MFTRRPISNVKLITTLLLVKAIYRFALSAPSKYIPVTIQDAKFSKL